MLKWTNFRRPTLCADGKWKLNGIALGYHLSFVILFGGLGIGMAARRRRVSQEYAEYQDSPFDGERCEICVMFREPNSCTKVLGSIKRTGWCVFFSPMKRKNNE